MAEDRIIRTCSFALILAGIAVVPAAASETPLSAYARARAADADGSVAEAARHYALALAARPDDAVIAVRALRQGLASGDLTLARKAGRVLTAADVAPDDLALLSFADALTAEDAADQQKALGILADGPLAFLVPILRAWILVDTRTGDPLKMLDSGDTGAVTRRYVAENRALLLLATGRLDEGLAATRALASTTQPTPDLAANAAALLAGAGRQDAALAMQAGQDPAQVDHAAAVGKGRKGDARFGSSRLFARVAADLVAEGTEPLTIMLARAALVIDPTYHRVRLSLADALARSGSVQQAEAALADIPSTDPFSRSVGASRIALLTRAGEDVQALAAARQSARGPDATSADLRNYADLLLEAGQFGEAADAYGTAMDRAAGGADWTLYLQRGGALEQAGQWERALPFLRRAAQLAPDEPAVLNYLGYAQVERSQNLEQATRLIERARTLAPEDPAIADSLGWAYFQRGDVANALPLLEQAARAEPADVTINEHLGDAYWKLGRRYEARYAWSAATITARDDVAVRLRSKLADGPTSIQR